jgi:hypothetical protein
LHNAEYLKIASSHYKSVGGNMKTDVDTHITTKGLDQIKNPFDHLTLIDNSID